MPRSVSRFRTTSEGGTKRDPPTAVNRQPSGEKAIARTYCVEKPADEAMFRIGCSCFTNNLYQWHYRNMVTGFRQYGNYNLYIYTNRRTVCDNNYFNNYCYSECYTNL